MNDATPKRGLAFGMLAAAALVAAVVSLAPRGPAPRVPAPPSGPAGAATDPAAGPLRADAPPAGAGPPARGEPAPPRLPRRIEAQARRAVDRYVDEAGLADRVGEADRAALVAALGRVRDSSRWMQRRARARGSAGARRREALIEADRVFRETLGVGVSQFIAALSPPSTVEDLGAARR